MAGGVQGGRGAMTGSSSQIPNFNFGQQGGQQGSQLQTSQFPGANLAAPGGMAGGSFNPNDLARPMPYQPPQQGINPTFTPQQQPAVMPQVQGPGGGMPQNMAQSAVMPQVQGPGGGMPQGMAQSAVMPQVQGPGGGMPQNMAQSAVMPQVQANMNNPVLQQAYLNAQQAAMGGRNAFPMPQNMASLGLMPQGDMGAKSAAPQDLRMQQNPRMTPRVSDMMPRREQMARPQIQGNPNSIPMQRGQGRVRNGYT